MNNKYDFVNKATTVHNGFYTYDNCGDDIISSSSVTITCPLHGEFVQNARKHLDGIMCFKCGVKKRTITLENFIKRANSIHNGYYLYGKINTIKTDLHVTITCPVHGDFKQKAKTHLSGSICMKCENESRSLSVNSFIEKAKLTHGERYNYDNVVYVDNKTKVEILCHEHGAFYQRPNHHMKGNKCSACARSDRSYNTEKFVAKAYELHHDLYDYTKSHYVDKKTKLTITCKLHGDFDQLPGNHINKKQGCPTCGLERKSKGEKYITSYLNKKGIEFVKEHRFTDCRYKNPLPFDYWLPNHNICIEYDGIQHYKPIDFFGGEEAFADRVIKDDIKTEYCERSGIKLLRIRYDDNISSKLNKITS